MPPPPRPQKKRANNPKCITESLKKVDREPQFNSLMFGRISATIESSKCRTLFHFTEPTPKGTSYRFSLSKLMYARKQTPHAPHTHPRQPNGFTLTKNRASRKLQKSLLVLVRWTPLCTKMRRSPPTAIHMPQHIPLKKFVRIIHID